MKIAFVLLALLTALIGISHRENEIVEAIHWVGACLIMGIAAIIYSIENKK